jgi:protein-S-isoprenylcysteine O-methyltransferase Ste14
MLGSTLGCPALALISWVGHPRWMDPRLRRYLLRQVAFVAFSVALMFLLAGRLDWLGGWLMTAIQVGSLAVQWLVVGRRYPDLLLERSGLAEDVERGDIPLALGMAYGPFVAMLVAGLEVRLQGLPDVAPSVAIAGVALAVAGIAVTVSAMLANRYFGPVVRIQSDRGHEVATTGPYAVVRHPGYVGAVLFYVGLPAVLGSWWSVPITALLIGITVVRTAREDRYLCAHLAGYEAYADRIRWRLAPRIW